MLGKRFCTYQPILERRLDDPGGTILCHGRSSRLSNAEGCRQSVPRRHAVLSSCECVASCACDRGRGRLLPLFAWDTNKTRVRNTQENCRKIREATPHSHTQSCRASALETTRGSVTSMDQTVAMRSEASSIRRSRRANARQSEEAVVKRLMPGHYIVFMPIPRSLPLYHT